MQHLSSALDHVLETFIVQGQVLHSSVENVPRLGLIDGGLCLFELFGGVIDFIG